MEFVNVFYVLCPEQRIHILSIRLVFLSSAFHNVQSSAKLVYGSDKPSGTFSLLSSRICSLLLVTNTVGLHVLDLGLWGSIIHENNRIKVKLSPYKQAHHRSFTGRERATCTHWLWHWVGPIASVDFQRREKSLPLPGFKPWVVQLPAESVYHPPKQTCILHFYL